MKTETRCHDCGCKEGELHDLGCDMETCPRCGGQIITCDCVYGMLGIDASPGTWAYSHGLTDKQEEEWQVKLEEIGRIPWLQIPNLCGYCGKRWPEFFTVSDEEWEKYVIPKLQRGMLCQKCYNKMKVLFPKGWRVVTHD